MAKTPNYSDAETAAIVARAPVNKAVAEELSAQLDRSLRSIIAKATREGVYLKQEPTTKSGEPIVSKADLVAEIGTVVDGNLDGLEKAPKAALLALRDAMVA